MKKKILLTGATLLLALTGCSRLPWRSDDFTSSQQPTPTTSEPTPTTSEPTPTTSEPTPTTSEPTPTTSEPTSSSQTTSSETTRIDPVEDEKVHIIVLAGQSGARGKALNSDLDPEYKEENQDVKILADGYAMSTITARSIPAHIASGLTLRNMKGGFGDSINENGPEVGIAESLASRYPGRAVIVKFTACGSDFVADWYSTGAINDSSTKSHLNMDLVRTNATTQKQTGPLTNNLYELVEEAKTLIANDGKEAVVDGIVWSHGEMDAQDDDMITVYKQNLKYFINDFREFVGNNELPFVITQSLTNSGRYSNDLKRIQKEVSDADPNTYMISNEGCHTNTFEPWHLGAPSNVLAGNEAAAEILSKKDSREVDECELETLDVPFGVNVELPKYLRFAYTNDHYGMSKVRYINSVNFNQEGEQTINYIVDTPFNTAYEGRYTVNVTKTPRVDGVLNDVGLYKEINIGSRDNKVKLYTAKSSDGVYFAGKISDTDIWTDGQDWDNGDMGQVDNSDDFRIYLVSFDGDASEHTTAAISAAGLLRYYMSGKSIHSKGAELNSIKNYNYVYKKTFPGDFAYGSTTEGLVNKPSGDASISWTFEVYFSFEALEVDNEEDLEVCFVHSDISNPNNKPVLSGERVVNEIGIGKSTASTQYPEDDKNSYWKYSEL